MAKNFQGWQKFLGEAKFFWGGQEGRSTEGAGGEKKTGEEQQKHFRGRGWHRVAKSNQHSGVATSHHCVILTLLDILISYLNV